jgi:hypothetical protein
MTKAERIQKYRDQAKRMREAAKFDGAATIVRFIDSRQAEHLRRRAGTRAVVLGQYRDVIH